MAAPTFVTANSVANANTTAISWTHPASTAAGDICVVSIDQDGSGGAISAPDGTWTALAGSPITSAGGSRTSAWWKRLGSGDPNTGTGNFSFTPTDFCSAVYSYYRGCPAAGDPQSAPATSQTFNATASLVLPSITTLDNDCMLVGLQGEQGIAATHTGFGSERVDIDGGSLYDVTQAVAGASGTKTITLSAATTAGGGFLVALKPAIVGGAGLRFPLKRGFNALLSLIQWQPWILQHPIPGLAAVGQLDVLAEGVTGIATVSASLTVSRAIAVTPVGIATVSPNLRVTRPIAVTVTGTTTITAQLRVTRRIAATVTGVATVTPSLQVTRRINATVAGVATVSTSLQVTRRLAVTTAGVATVAPSLSATRPIAVTVTGTSAITPVLRVTRRIAVTVTGTSTITAALAIAKFFNATPAGVSTVTIGLTVAKGLAVTPTGVSTVTATTSVTRRLAVTPIGVATVSGSLVETKRYAVSLAGTSVVSFSLTGTQSSPSVTVQMSALFRRRRYQRWERTIRV